MWPARLSTPAGVRAQREDVSGTRQVLRARARDRRRGGSCARGRRRRCRSSRRARASIDTQNAVPRRAVFVARTISGISSSSRRSGVIGRQIRPRPCVAMKLTISGVTCSAAQTRSPSFSRSSSSRMTIIRPARSSSIASSTVANAIRPRVRSVAHRIPPPGVRRSARLSRYRASRSTSTLRRSPGRTAPRVVCGRACAGRAPPRTRSDRARGDRQRDAVQGDRPLVRDVAARAPTAARRATRRSSPRRADRQHARRGVDVALRRGGRRGDRPARSARSRLTRPPTRSRPSVVRESVSATTSTTNRSSRRSATVRQTPSTATLSPELRALARQVDRDRQIAPPRRTLPHTRHAADPLDEPGEHGAQPIRRASTQQIGPQRDDPTRVRAAGRAPAPRCRARRRAAFRPAAPSNVGATNSATRSAQSRRRGTPRASGRRPRRAATARRSRRGRRSTRARSSPPCASPTWITSATRASARSASTGGCAAVDTRVRGAPGGVREHGARPDRGRGSARARRAARGAAHAGQPHRQRGSSRAHRPRADEQRVVRRRRRCAKRRAASPGDPARALPAGACDPAVEGHAGLERHERPTALMEGQERRVELPCLPRRSRPTSTRDPRRLQAPRSPCRRRAGSDPACAATTRAHAALRSSRSAQGGGPAAMRARLEVHVHRRAAGPRAGLARRRGPRRAADRPRGGSPDRPPARRARARNPRAGSGSSRPRPAAARASACSMKALSAGPLRSRPLTPRAPTGPSTNASASNSSRSSSPLTDSDVADRHAELAVDAERDPALGRSVELRQHDPRDRRRARELARPARGRSARSSRRRRAAPRAAPRRPLAPATRPSLLSSAIRFVFVCRRPAVSTSTVSTPRAFAARSASKTTAAGSAPSRCLISSTPARARPSARAARSPRRGTCRRRRRAPCVPRRRSRAASLPTVVVLPPPLTPTTNTTRGGAPRARAGRAAGIAERSARRTASRTPPAVGRSAPAERTASITSAVSAGPRSAASSARLELFERSPRRTDSFR